MGNLIEFFFQLKGMKIRVLCFDDIIRISSFLPLDSFIEVSDYVRASNGTFYYNNDNKALFFSFSSGLDQDKLLTISNEVEEEAESWVKEAPIIPNSVVNNDLWNYVWVLHRFFCLQVFRTEPDCSHIEDPKSKICNLSFRDLVCVLDDLMWYKPDFVCSFLKVIKEFYITDDGLCESNDSMQNTGEHRPIISQPPLLSYFILEFHKYTKNFDVITEWYPLLKKNIEWWEKNRLDKEIGLFVLDDTIENICTETDIGRSERFYIDYSSPDYKILDSSTRRKVIPVDLNSQMADLYQNVGVMAILVEDFEYNVHCFSQADTLQNRVQEFLWDEDTQFFYDFDLDTNAFIKVKTSAAFWTLFGGTATKTQGKILHDAILDKSQFWSEFPIGSVPLNSELVEKEILTPRTYLSNNIWFIIGLKRNNFHITVSQLAIKTLTYLGRNFSMDQKIFDYYPANSYSLSVFNKGNFDKFPKENRLEYFPIHSLVYRGILGAEVLDEGISFVPDWLTIDSTIKFSIFYDGKKHECYLDKFHQKLLNLP